MANTAKIADLRRVQFDLLPDRLAQYGQLMAFCGLTTRKELFDHAMTLFEWAIQEVRAGNDIAAYNRRSDHVEIVRLPVLENAARRAQSHGSVTPVSTAAARPPAEQSTTTVRPSWPRRFIPAVAW